LRDFVREQNSMAASGDVPARFGIQICRVILFRKSKQSLRTELLPRLDTSHVTP
jgi:hypothetical protein